MALQRVMNIIMSTFQSPRNCECICAINCYFFPCHRKRKGLDYHGEVMLSILKLKKVETLTLTRSIVVVGLFLGGGEFTLEQAQYCGLHLLSLTCIQTLV